MKISKKAITLLVMTTLLMSMIPIMPANAGIEIGTIVNKDPLHITSGDKGDTVVVKGKGVTSGSLVELFWDSVGSWDGVEGLLNASKAKPDGSYEVWFDIPETVVGDHYLWVRDANTGETMIYPPFEVVPLVKISASSGLPTDRPTITGYGFKDDVDTAIVLTLPDLLGWNIESGGVASGDGIKDTFEFTLDAPIEISATPITITDTVETFTEFSVEDTLIDGNLVGTAGGSGTINYVTGEVKLTFSVPPADLSNNIIASYRSYVNEPSTNYVFAVGAGTSALGSVTRSVTIPGLPDMDYWEYRVIVFDEKGNIGVTPFTVGAVISLNVDEGPSGTVVEIVGKGFDGTATTIEDPTIADIIRTGDVYLKDDDGTLPNLPCTIIDVETGIPVEPDGEFKIEVVIPSDADYEDYEQLTVDTFTGSTIPTSADFDVTGESCIEVTPGYGIQGASMVIEGWNFTAISGEEVVIDLYAEGDALGFVLQNIEKFETDSNGHFLETIQIPAISSGEYDIGAHQIDYNLAASDALRVGMMIVIMSPESGPTGTEVTLSGTGYTKSMTWNATFGEDTLFESELVSPEGNLKMEQTKVPMFYVPTIDTGVYTISVLDMDADISVEVEFEVTETTMIETDPIVAPADYTVTLKGYYFKEDIALIGDIDEFVMYNDTKEWTDTDLEFDFSPVEEDDEWDDGYFEGTFKLPDEDEIGFGTYTINVTDNEGLFAQLEFDVVPKTTQISTRKPTFKIGDTVAFDVESSFKQRDSYIKIYDPSDNLYWQLDAFNDGVGVNENDLWLQVGTVVIVPYYLQTAGGNPLMLLDDAPLGTWKWIWYDEFDEELDTGLFSVDPAPEDLMIGQIVDLNNEINELANQMTDVSDSFSAFENQLSDLEAISAQTAASAERSAEAIQIVASTANTASVAAENAAEAANAAMEASKSLNTLVYGAIGASLVAALAAIVSLMQISKRIAG